MADIEVWLITYKDLSNLPHLLENLYKVPDVSVAVVDNSVSEDTKAQIQGLLRGKDRSYFPERNLFCCRASQYLLETTTAHYCIYLCAPHVHIYDPSFVDDCVRVLDAGMVGLAGDVVVYPGLFYYQSSWSLARFPSDHPSYFPDPMPKLEGQFSLPEIYEKADTRIHVQGGLWAAKPDILKEVGGFDTAFVHKFMDIELSVRVQCYGYTLARVDSVKSDYRSDKPTTSEAYKAVHKYSD
jgi:GT2 family glycosyltransferase